jgi:hypothetical protein
LAVDTFLGHGLYTSDTMPHSVYTIYIVWKIMNIRTDKDLMHLENKYKPLALLSH